MRDCLHHVQGPVAQRKEKENATDHPEPLRLELSPRSNISISVGHTRPVYTGMHTPYPWTRKSRCIGQRLEQVSLNQDLHPRTLQKAGV